jgi:hypothetical protein
MIGVQPLAYASWMALKSSLEPRRSRSPIGESLISQTLIVLSHEPDTIVLPSGEKATEATALLCALAFSLFSSSVPAEEARNGQLWPGKGDLGPKTHLRPRL